MRSKETIHLGQNPTHNYRRKVTHAVFGAKWGHQQLSWCQRKTLKPVIGPTNRNMRDLNLLDHMFTNQSNHTTHSVRAVLGTSSNMRELWNKTKGHRMKNARSAIGYKLLSWVRYYLLSSTKKYQKTRKMCNLSSQSRDLEFVLLQTLYRLFLQHALWR